MRKNKKLLPLFRVLLASVLSAAVLCTACADYSRTKPDSVQSSAGEKDTPSVAAVPDIPVSSGDDPGGTSVGVQPESGTEAVNRGGGQPESGAIESGAAERDLDAADRPEEISGSLFHEGCTLEQVVVFSRHNIRAPYYGSGTILSYVTPHEWHVWDANSSELSLRGGALETMMGLYFREWLEAEGFFPENYHPEEGAVRIYANSKQRTIATAQFFTAGLLPTAGMPIEYHMEYGGMDPVFMPQMNYMSQEYADDIRAQIFDMFSEKIEDMEDNCELLFDVIDLEDSEAWREGSITGFYPDDTEINLEAFLEPQLKGSFKRAAEITDAMVLQYYEEPDAQKAAFGSDLSREDWEKIGEIKDLYGEILFTAPLVAPNTAHPLLEELRSELREEARKFSFLCGHDSNVGSILAALGVEPYSLPGAIEKKTPIGGKIVFSRWRNPEGREQMSVDMVYQTTDQIRDVSLLNLENPPAVYPLSLQGLERNEYGLYEAEDVMDCFDRAIEEYDTIRKKYGM